MSLITWKLAPLEPSHISLQLAGTADACSRVLNAWKHDALYLYGVGLGLDCLLIAAYLWFGFQVANWVDAQPSQHPSARRTLRSLAKLAATADLFENLMHWALIDGGSCAAPLHFFAWTATVVKWGGLAGYAIAFACFMVPGWLADEDEPNCRPAEWPKVFEAELDALADGDKAKREAMRGGVLGLALSGGGIRSASFALGVFQAMIDFNVAEKFHYLSTVSGGGYLGVAVSWLRKRDPEHWKQEFDSRRGTRRKVRHAARARAAADATPGTTVPSMPAHPVEATWDAAAATRDGDAGSEQEEAKPVWLDYIRQHSNYLQPLHLGLASLAGVALRNIALSVGVYVALAALALQLLGYAGFFEQPKCRDFFLYAPFATFAPALCWDATSLALAACLMLVFTFVVYSFGSFVISLEGGRERVAATAFLFFPALALALGLRPQDLGQYLCAACTQLPPRWGSSLLLSSAFVGAVCVVYALARAARAGTRDVENVNSDQGLYGLRLGLQWLGGVSIAVLLGLTGASVLPDLAAPSLQREVLSLLVALAAGILLAPMAVRAGVSRSTVSQLQLVLGFLAVILIGALAAYLLAVQLRQLTLLGWLAATVVILLVAFCTNLNQFGIGRMYRDRLMEAFMPDQDSIKQMRWMPALEANKDDDGLLANLWTPGQDPRLYPLINTHVVLTDSDQDIYRNRGGDSFVLSPLFCGSNATGWVDTEQFADRKLKAGTAMAISGAAANPNAASGGHGFTRNRLASFLMFLAQARLGAWVRNPRQLRLTHWARFKAWMLGHRPNFLFPGIRSGLFGRGLHERGYFLELTDGGHFDNTGAYELVRRRAKLIVLAQASQDHDYGFGDLANFAEKIRVDFGARLFFREGLNLEQVIPRSDNGRRTVASRGHAIARIEYGNGDKGWLVYLQATPVVRLPVDVHSYYHHHRDFPNEPTANQFFREAQMEAYRELGYAVTKRFLMDVACSHDGLEPCNCNLEDANAHEKAVACLVEINGWLEPSTDRVKLRGRQPRPGSTRSEADCAPMAVNPAAAVSSPDERPQVPPPAGGIGIASTGTVGWSSPSSR